MNPIRIAVDGAHGAGAWSFYPKGFYGCGGGNGRDGGNLSVTMRVRNGVGEIVRDNLTTFFDPHQVTTIFLSARGGNGGEGGKGLDGLRGIDGGSGMSGHRGNGSDGYNGYSGGTGGAGGNGGKGGNGGHIEVVVPRSQAYLLKLLQTPSVEGGSGGKGGAGGQGGLGGSGGAGGRGYGWYENETYYSVSSRRLETRSVYHTASDGSRGLDGLRGSDGVRGIDGLHGYNGTVSYCLKSGGIKTKYSEIFLLSLSHMGHGLPEGSIYEPGASYSWRGVQVTNASSMPLPAMDAPFQIALESNRFIEFVESSAITVPDLRAHSSAELEGELRFRVRPIDFNEIRAGDLFSKKVTLSYLLRAQAIGRVISFQGLSPIQIAFPVKMLPIQLPDVIVPGEVIPLEIRVLNLLDRALGANSRAVAIRLEVEREGKNISLIDPEKSSSLAAPWSYNIPHLSSKKTTLISRNLIFRSNILPYRPIYFTASLLLEDLKDPSKLNVVQKIRFSAVVSTPFVFDPEADIILCVNRNTPASTIDGWRQYLSRISMKLSIWDVSLYDGFRFSDTVGNSSLKNLLRGKVVVLLNSACPTLTRKEPVLPTSLLNPKDLFTALKETGLYVLGGSFELSAHLTKAFKRYYSVEHFLAKRDPTKNARITIQEVSILRPSESRLLTLAQELLNQVQTLDSKKRFLIKARPDIKQLERYWATKLWELGVLEVIGDDPLKLIAHPVKDAAIHAVDPSQFFQAIKLLPLERKLEQLHVSRQDKASSVFSRAILAELIGDLFCFWNNHLELFSEGAIECILRKFSVVRDRLLSPKLFEALSLRYESILERMERERSLSSNRFKHICLRVKETLVQIRREQGIIENKYQTAKRQFLDTVQSLSIQKLLEENMIPICVESALQTLQQLSPHPSEPLTTRTVANEERRVVVLLDNEREVKQKRSEWSCDENTFCIIINCGVGLSASLFSLIFCLYCYWCVRQLKDD